MRSSEGLEDVQNPFYLLFSGPFSGVFNKINSKEFLIFANFRAIKWKKKFERNQVIWRIAFVQLVSGKVSICLM